MSHPQLPLALRYPPDQRLQTFIGTPFAVELLAALACGERAEWVFVSGPGGSGKSHLLLAACAAASDAGRRTAYLPLAHARGHLRDLLAMQESADLVALDGLDAVSGERDDEIALFDFHNRARAAGSVVLYAARQTPANLALDLPDLRSRLSQCIQLPLEVLDETGRRELLRRRAQARGLQFDESAIDYLFRRADRDLASLTALLEQLDRASLSAQRRITVPFLRGLIG